MGSGLGLEAAALGAVEPVQEGADVEQEAFDVGVGRAGGPREDGGESAGGHVQGGGGGGGAPRPGERPDGRARRGATAARCPRGGGRPLARGGAAARARTVSSRPGDGATFASASSA